MTIAEAHRAGPVLSIVTPAYNEAENLPLLYARLTQALGAVDVTWEWVVVDDHSSDATFQIVAGLRDGDARVRAVRLARNSGSHAAISCGLRYACGDCAVVMAADLQDPPETLPALLAEWRGGAQVVWAVRARREGESASTVVFARIYYFLMRRLAGFKEMPATGADFFLVDRRVLAALQRFGESNVSILMLITWMGFRQATIRYEKQARAHGRSGWSLAKKLKLVVDSVTSFSFAPIRFMSYVGLTTSVLGFLYALVVIFNALRGLPPEGWASLMVVVLVLGGIQMVMLGVLGEYLWRTLDEARHRPRYIVEAALGDGRDEAPGYTQPGFEQLRESER